MTKSKVSVSLAGILAFWGSTASATPASWADFVDVDPLGGRYESDLIQQFANKVVFFLDAPTPQAARYDLDTKQLEEHRCDAVTSDKLDGDWQERSANVLTNTISHGTDDSKMLVWWNLAANLCFIATPVTNERTEIIHVTTVSPDERHLYYSMISKDPGRYDYRKVGFYETDLATGQASLLHEVEGPFSSWLADFPIHATFVDGKPTLFMGVPSSSVPKIFKLDLESRKSELVKETKEEGRISQIAYSEAGKRVFFQTMNGGFTIESDGTTTSLTDREDVLLSPDRTRFCRSTTTKAEIVDLATLAVVMSFGDRQSCQNLAKSYQGAADFSFFSYWAKDSYPYTRTLYFCDENTKGCQQMDVDEEEANESFDHFVIRPQHGVIMNMTYEVRDHHLYGLVEKRGKTREVIADLEYDLQTDEVFRLNGTGSLLFLHGDGLLKMLPLR